MTSGGGQSIGGRSIERKVITALFCDLVGSTELGERLDPEDIDALLSSYYRLARARIETHGGRIEKFIGDAVVGLFGATQIHEDDASRAVRAALAIIRELESANLGIHVRIGIQTGEAVVHVGGQRSFEEGIAVGDLLNTASRLQNAAPVGGIAVGQPTYRRTKTEFEWHDLGEVVLKGKAQPVQLWQPTTERSSLGQPTPESTPFLGRDAEMGTLLAAFQCCATEQRIQLVTIVAEPGMGKSRLVRELGRQVTQRPDVTWRSGRCLPYGDGISFWALGEIVKHHAGILETDDQQTVGAKLDAALDATLSEPEPDVRAWLRERLSPLVGLQSDAAPPQHDELFAAWTRFLMAVAAKGPTVLVVEDLHWADTALVDFLIQLADHTEEAPLLIVVTARPEVAGRHPAWLERAGKSTLVQLTSLGDGDIRQMVKSPLAGASEEFIDTVLERAAGSPLYAEQLAALVRERGLTTESAVLDESMIPPSIQALLAARVDGLPRELKPVLLDASVIGRVFWSGAVANLEGRPGDEAESALEDLSRREFARHQYPSSMADESEYGFWHALLRDVAYSFLPRAARLAKHRAAAAWITAQSGERLGDLAEIVADHLRRAQDLAAATGAEDDLPAIRSDLASALLAAADHTMRIEPARAIGQLRDALDLLAADDPRRATALTVLGQAHLARSEYRDAAEMLEAAASWYAGQGQELAAAELATKRARALSSSGRHPEATTVRAEAQPILEATPGPGLVEYLADSALRFANHAEYREAIETAENALRLAAELGLPPPFLAFQARGGAIGARDPAKADQDLLKAVELAMAAGDHRSAFTAMGWRPELYELEHWTLVLARHDEVVAFAHRYGLADAPARALRLDALEMAGRWDELLDEAAALREDAVARGDGYTTFMVRMESGSVQVERGEATDGLDDLATAAESIGFPPYVGGSIPAMAHLRRGEHDAARAAVETTLGRVPDHIWVTNALEHVRVCFALRDLNLARRVLAKSFPFDSHTVRGYLTKLAGALVLELEGKAVEAHQEFAETHAFFEKLGLPWYSTHAQFGEGRCLIAMGEAAQGVELLRGARDTAIELKATPTLLEIEAAIAGARP